eukprot:6187189-Pleurochrysis_carterae.AAC.3
MASKLAQPARVPERQIGWRDFCAVTGNFGLCASRMNLWNDFKRHVKLGVAVGMLARIWLYTTLIILPVVPGSVGTVP